MFPDGKRIRGGAQLSEFDTFHVTDKWYPVELRFGRSFVSFMVPICFPAPQNSNDGELEIGLNYNTLAGRTHAVWFGSLTMSRFR